MWILTFSPMIFLGKGGGVGAKRGRWGKVRLLRAWVDNGGGGKLCALLRGGRVVNQKVNIIVFDRLYLPLLLYQMECQYHWRNNYQESNGGIQLCLETAWPILEPQGDPSSPGTPWWIFGYHCILLNEISSSLSIVSHPALHDQYTFGSKIPTEIECRSSEDIGGKCNDLRLWYLQDERPL